MMKRFSLALVGLVVLSFSTGCCGWWGHHGVGYGYGNPTYGSPSYGSPNCPSGNCGAPPGIQGVPPQTSYYQSGSAHSVQTVPQTINGPVTFAPAGYPAVAVPQTAAAPLESLPTY